MTMKLWQTHTKLLFLVSGIWPWCVRPCFACWALIFFVVHPFFLKKGAQGCAGMPEQSLCVLGCWGSSLSCQHVGISAWKPMLLGWEPSQQSQSRWDAQPEPARLVYALLIRHVIRVICVFFPFLLSKPVLLLGCPQRLWWGAQFESLRVAWQHLFIVVCVSAVKTLGRELRGVLRALGIRILGVDGTVLVEHPAPVYCQCLWEFPPRVLISEPQNGLSWEGP